MDKKNEKIYTELLDKAKRSERIIQNSILSVNLEVPPPPRPTNLEKYNIWEKRNVEKPVIEQSEAVLFLQSRGYVLNNDYEAYQAISLSKEIKRSEGIEDLPDDKTTQFDSVFTNNDTNIYRRRSIHRMSTIDINNENIQQENVTMRRNTVPSQYNYTQYYKENNQIKPSAPPISHNVIYPEPSKIYSDFEV